MEVHSHLLQDLGASRVSGRLHVANSVGVASRLSHAHVACEQHPGS
ncbi:hypothetical protein LINGRAHAP2_LOCUS16914, partial [Linum grandiflorum]